MNPEDQIGMLVDFDVYLADMNEDDFEAFVASQMERGVSEDDVDSEYID